MPDIVDLIDSCLIKDVIDVSWEVVDTHLMEREVPVLLIIISQVDMLVRVGGAPVVAKPNIKSSSCEIVGKLLIWGVEEPSSCNVDEPMLEENDFLLSIFVKFRLNRWIPDVPKSKNVSILCSHIEFFE